MLSDITEAAFMNEAQTIILLTDGESSVVVEPGHPLWDDAVALGPSPFVPPPAPDPLETERAGMVVSRLQARAALLQLGMLDMVEKAVSGGLLTGSQVSPLVQLAWREATEFRRNSPTIAAVGKLMGLSDDALDDLFRAAVKIEF